MSWWRDKAHECPLCGWQGMAEPSDPICPECGEPMTRRTWLDTWGLTLLILGVVVAAVLFVAYFGQSGRLF
jgi:hypothetical protein